MPAGNNDLRELYWEAYGMTHDPFAALSERYFYPLPEWDEQAQLLEHTTLYNNLFVIVQGPRGSGKTTFMEHLQQRLSPTVACYQIDGDPELSPDEMLQVMGHAYSLPDLPIGRLPLSDLFKLQLAQICRTSRHCVLMIDDAHLLPYETLNALFLCVKEQGKMPVYFHLVLFAEPTISNWKNTLDNQDSEQYLQEIMMPRLDGEMAEKYLEHRFHSAGLNQEMPLSSDEIDTITEEAHGLIGEINHLTKNHLLSLNSPKRPFLVSKNVSRTALMLGAAMLLAVTVGFFLWSSFTPRNAEMALEDQEASQTMAQLPTPEALKEMLPAQPPMPAATPAEEPTLVSQIAPVHEDDLETMVLPSKIASIDIKDFAQKPVAKLVAKPIAKAPVKPVAVARNGYVIQVFATHEKASAEKFIRQQGLAHKAKLYPAKFAGKPGYLVLMGPYHNEQLARSRVASLSPSIRQLHPWVREFRNIV